MTTPPTAELRVDPLSEGAGWTWRYVEPGVELNSNETYATREAATNAARRAYPDLSVTDEPRS